MGPVRLTLAWKMEQHYFHKLILCISHEFSQIMGHGEYGKVHIDLVFSCVTETSVVPVVFYLSENSLRFYWSPASSLILPTFTMSPYPLTQSLNPLNICLTSVDKKSSEPKRIVFRINSDEIFFFSRHPRNLPKSHPTPICPSTTQVRHPTRYG